jgi:hypothetical protein
MTVYSGPVFDMAVNRFGVIADHLSIPPDGCRTGKNSLGLFP